MSIEPSAEIAQALMLVDAPLTDDPFALDASMRQLLASRAGIDLDLARLLRNFRSLDLARHLGFRSFAHYVNDRLGISVARARFLVTLDRALTGFPETAVGPPLRASPEQVRSTVSKSASKQTLAGRRFVIESGAFMNNPG